MAFYGLFCKPAGGFIRDIQATMMYQLFLSASFVLFAALALAQPPDYASVKAALFKDAPLILECRPLLESRRVYYDREKKMAYYACHAIRPYYWRGGGVRDTIRLIYFIDPAYVPPADLTKNGDALIYRGRYNSANGSDLPCPKLDVQWSSLFFCQKIEPRLKAELGTDVELIIYDFRYPGVQINTKVEGCGEMQYESVKMLRNDILRFGKLNQR